MKLLKMPQEKSKDRIVELLERALEQAKRGEIAKIFLLTEADNAENFERTNDGFSLMELLWMLEAVKARTISRSD